MKKSCILAIIIFCFLCGCGKTATDSYIDSMTQYVNELQFLGEKIDQIDIENDSAPTELIKTIDQMHGILTQMADLDAPEGNSTLSNLANSASSAMTAASGYYSQAYTKEGYDILAGKEGIIQYKNAMTYLHLIGELLAGNEISEDNVQLVNE